MEEFRNFLTEKNVINSQIYATIKDQIICTICKDIMIAPMICLNCQNSFCKTCIEKWNLLKQNCPFRCKSPNFKKSVTINQLVSKLEFKCEECNATLNYDDMKKHFFTKCGSIEFDYETYNLNRKHSIKGIFQKIDEQKKPTNVPIVKIKSKIIVYLYIFIVIVLGLSGVGKTSLIRT